MTNLSLSLVNMLYNFQLIRLAGEDGVAAYGVIMYVNLIFLGVFIGYSIGSAPGRQLSLRGRQPRGAARPASPEPGYPCGDERGHDGAGGGAGLAPGRIFVGYDAALLEMTRHGFVLYSLSFLFAGGGIFGSAFFTALNNGAVSALISFLRALVFQMAAVLLLPPAYGAGRRMAGGGRGRGAGGGGGGGLLCGEAQNLRILKNVPAFPDGNAGTDFFYSSSRTQVKRGPQ